MDYSFSELNETSLRTLYTDFGLRAKEIGTLVGLTESAILLKLKKFSIPPNPKNIIKKEVTLEYTGKNKSRKNNLTNELLKELYSIGQTDIDIGRMFGLTGEAIAYRRKKLGIVTRNPNMQRINTNHMRGLKDIKELSLEELRTELSVYRGIKGVARKYSTTFAVVHDLIIKFGLNRDEILSDHIILSELQKKLIIGGLLGDGGIYDGGIRGYYYKEGHCIQQIEYVKWKVNLLKDLIMDDLYYETKISDLNTKSHIVSFRTNKYIELAPFRDLFYKFLEKKFIKTIPETIIQSMDAFIFSIWYFDDGGLSGKGLPYICSGSPKEDIIRTAEILNERFDLNAYTELGNSISFIFFRNVQAFFNLIKNFVLPCFYYKIPVEFRFQLPEIPSDISILPELIQTYNPKQWRELPSEKQKIWVENIVKYYSFIGFPFYRIRSKKETEAIFHQLQHINLQPEVLQTGIFNKVNFVGSALASAYFPHMWASKVRGKRSAYNNYIDSNRFRVVVEKVLKYRNIVSDASIRSELRHGSTVQNFKPLIAKTLYDLYCPENGIVFDYSAGYGGRLVGACVSSKVSTYIGTDPCEQTFFGLRKLSRKLERYFPHKKFQIFNQCSEDARWYPTPESIDVCFSSPPYFDTEKYSDEDTQSYLRYPKIDLWVNGFLRPTIENCCRILKNGGYFIINIADTGKYELQKSAFEILVKNLSFERFFLICMPSYFGADKYEPIFIFKKITPVPVSYDNIKAQMQIFCGTLVKIKEPELRTINRTLISLTEDQKIKAVECMQNLIKEGIKPSRRIVSSLSFQQFPYVISRIEKAFNGWTPFLKTCGFISVYEAHLPVEHVKDYLNICLKLGRILSFYEYEKQTSNPSTRLKRLFNAGKPYHHLKDELKLVALCPELWPVFLAKIA